MPTYDLVIRNGMIVDGPRNPRYKGDVGIKDGKIARMGRASRPVRAELREEPLKYMFIGGVDEARVVSVAKAENQQYEDMSVQEIADQRGVHPVDAICDLVVSDNLATSFQAPQFDIGLEGIKQLLDNP